MRINVLPVKLLADQHLVAEYREIKMLPKCLVRSIKSSKGIDYKTIPSNYTLNAGHGKFFYNKLGFIENRFQELITEMKERCFTVNCTELYDKNYDYSSISNKNYSENYIPTFGDKMVNAERILQRISERPEWYKFYGINTTFSEFKEYYEEMIKD